MILIAGLRAIVLLESKFSSNENKSQESSSASPPQINVAKYGYQ